MIQKFVIEFSDEQGYDAGGLLREWFTQLSKEIFNPMYPFFIPVTNGNSFIPNQNSSIDIDHLKYFHFIGRIVGKALFEDILLDAYFVNSFYKNILDSKLNFDDLEDYDPEYYKNMKQYVLEGDPQNLELTFSYEVNEFDVVKEIPLIENGEQISVTNENKFRYLQLLVEHKLKKSIQNQIDSFKKGFFEVIPNDLIKIFNQKELQLMISGIPYIDIMDLQLNTEYHGYSKNQQIIIWFWEIMIEFDDCKKANFLQFITGSSKVPLDGFANLKGNNGIQKFQIHKNYNSTHLPTAHTCFNQLDLPEYTTKEELQTKLLQSIELGKDYFGIV